MKTWYLTRDGVGDAQHKGQSLEPNKFVLLSDQQAELHNKAGKQVVAKASSPPKTANECQFPEEFSPGEPTEE